MRGSGQGREDRELIRDCMTRVQDFNLSTRFDQKRTEMTDEK